ncbi:MAG: hypothetical protein A2527_04085 [Candidatus Lambdaproteobacteria bacterium RIFOXYD2_FULL_50_16]|uniref:Uncharacterized protein n=1 Tax=Candidatus Lambdaproteobacteria bacterium RIFOXYD2_FULL_50_16 TaxID=1817772 RepID=A0A1F6GF51_9PROT|nr:MAG: hypothetical protein A2527_04085 [Candidatus Lambdaproteobacteria bacterium RIFOXYD2_FULL_50_16]
MAGLKDHIRVQICCADLAVERQALLKEQIGDQLTRLNQEDPSVLREMVFISNNDLRPIDAVLTANPKADVVFSGFNVTRVTEKGNKASEAMVDETNSTGLNIDPTLRLGAYIQLQKMIARGQFKMRRMIFVGPLNERVREFLKLGFEVKASFFTDADRTTAGEPVLIKSPAQLPKIGDFAQKGQIELSDIHQLTIGDITFDGVVNMEEEGGHFYVKDFTIDDSVKKLLDLDGEKAVLVAEAVKEEKMAFVRTKKVVLCMPPELASIVKKRLEFDKMEQLFQYRDPKEALTAIEESKSGGVADFLEEAGYEVVNKVLEAKDREAMLVAVIGPRKMPTYLEREMKSGGEDLKLFSDDQVKELFAAADDPVLNRLIAKVQETDVDAFLARIPSEVREPLIIQFLKDPKMAAEAWRVIGPKAQKEVLVGQCTAILAAAMLTNTALFKAKLPKVVFNQDQSYDSAKQFKSLDAAGIKLRMEIFAEGLAGKSLTYAEWATSFEEEERESILSQYIAIKTDDFFNNLEGSYKKIIWNVIGKKGQKDISVKLTGPHKRAILTASKEQSLGIIKTDIAYLAGILAKDQGLAFGETLFLSLKQFNKVESKTGLFKKLTTDEKHKPFRVEGVTKLLASERGKPIFEKLTEQIDALNVGYDSLITMREFAPALTAHEALAGATVTIVEDLVDTSLLEMFAKGEVDFGSYEEHQKQVEKKIAALKEQLRSKGADDPVGGYLLETMVIMMNMASEALQNKLDQKMLDALDERGKVKQEVLDNVAKRLSQLEERVTNYKLKLPEMGKRLEADSEKVKSYAALVGEKLNKLQLSLQKYQDAETKLNQYQRLKVKVARVQQQLSERFFEIIRPLILQKLRILPAPMARVIDSFKQSFLSNSIPKHRLIFKFTDDELKGIAKRNVVFATEDKILKAFIVTCLHIDKLDNTLFMISGLDDLPEKPDLLFVGNDLLEYDFSEIIKEQFTVPFADDAFYKTLSTNESQKAAIRANLEKYREYRDKYKNYLETEGSKLKVMAVSQKTRTDAIEKLRANRKKYQESLKVDQERLAFLKAEQESLGAKFEAIDDKFKAAKSAITQAISSGQSTATTITQQTQAMSQGLSKHLEDINKDLAGMMFVKNVKDTVERISSTAQEQIISKVDQLSVIPGGKAAVKHIVVSGDGMLETMEMQKAFATAIKSYFGQQIKFEELGLGRMEAEIVEEGKRPHLVIILMNDEPSGLANLAGLAKRLRAVSPESCVLMFSAYQMEEASAELIHNLNTLRKYATPINTNLTDYTVSAKVTKLLGQVAP